MTGTLMLPRLVGPDVAKELTFTGRMVSGEEAGAHRARHQLADDPRADALELAAELAARAPTPSATASALLNLSGTRRCRRAVRRRAPDDGLASSAAPNQVEAVTAYFEKRPPMFTDP